MYLKENVKDFCRDIRQIVVLGKLVSCFPKRRVDFLGFFCDENIKEMNPCDISYNVFRLSMRWGFGQEKRKKKTG